MATSAVVLNVDHQPASLYVRERYLREWGYRVENAATGRAAMMAAERLLPALILLDIHLPDIDGRELCRQLKAHPVLGRIPVVLVSATLTGHAAHLETIRWGGADAFVAEPFEPDDLLSTIRKLLHD